LILTLIDKEIRRNTKNFYSRNKSCNLRDKNYDKSFNNVELNNEYLSNSDIILNLEEKNDLNIKNYIISTNNFESIINETMASTYKANKDNYNTIKMKKSKKEVIKDIEPKNFNDNYIYFNKKYESKSRRKNKDSEIIQEESKKNNEKSYVETIDNENYSKGANFQNAYITNLPDIDILDIDIRKKPENLESDIVSEKLKELSKNKGKKFSLSFISR